MEEALYNDIYTRGSGGNFPRNVALYLLAEVDLNEVLDATPYAIDGEKHF